MTTTENLANEIIPQYATLLSLIDEQHWPQADAALDKMICLHKQRTLTYIIEHLQFVINETKKDQ